MPSEYEEIVKKIPVPERAIGPLTGLATRLDYLGPKVEDLSSLSPKVDALTEKVNKVEYALRTLELPEGVAMPQRIVQIPFVRNLEKAGIDGSQAMLTEYAPFSGYIKEVTPHFPDGCNAKVQVRVGRGPEQFCPREGYLAINDATPTYPFNEWCNDHDEIWVEMINGDGANKHQITVSVTLAGVAA